MVKNIFAISFLPSFLISLTGSVSYERSKWELRDYNEMVNYCATKGLFPASFHSQAQLNELGDLCGNRNCWLGFDDKSVRDVWDFVDTSEFDLEPPWAPGMPQGVAVDVPRCGFIDKDNARDGDGNVIISTRSCDQDYFVEDTFALCGDGIDDEELCPHWCPTVSFDGCNHCWCGRDDDNTPCEDNVCHGENEYTHRRCLWVDRVLGGCPANCRIVDDGCRKCLCRPGFRLCQSDSQCSQEEILKADSNICDVSVDEFDALMATDEGIEKIFGSFKEWEFDTQVDWVERADDRGYLDDIDLKIIEGMKEANKQLNDEEKKGESESNTGSKSADKRVIPSWIYVFGILLTMGSFALYWVLTKCSKKNGLDRFCSQITNDDEFSPLLNIHSSETIQIN